ncbi:MAG: hypothetical protein JWM52_832, partial [Candidatus Saccharibacteria bacterium]|nr:hypothetical protein [Candidatus Saccharibacteria bacterium]
MNPNDKAPLPPAPSAGDEAALQAIEALEAETNEVSGADPVIESPTPVIPAAPIQVSTPPVISTPVIPTPTGPIIPDVITEPAPLPPVQNAPSNEVARSIAASLSEETPAAPITNFQPFSKQKKSLNKPVIILVVVLVLAILGVGGYFGWQYLQPKTTTPTVTQTTPTSNAADETAPISDTEASVTDTATNMQSQLDS